MGRVPVLLALIAVIAGCGGGSDATGPSVPDVAGTYQGAFTLTASSTAGSQNLGVFPATATITQRKTNLSISIVDQQGGSITFTGIVAAGGAIA